jgi:hypothetical protein
VPICWLWHGRQHVLALCVCRCCCRWWATGAAGQQSRPACRGAGGWGGAARPQREPQRDSTQPCVSCDTAQCSGCSAQHLGLSSIWTVEPPCRRERSCRLVAKNIREHDTLTLLTSRVGRVVVMKCKHRTVAFCQSIGPAVMHIVRLSTQC